MSEPLGRGFCSHCSLCVKSSQPTRRSRVADTLQSQLCCADNGSAIEESTHGVNKEGETGLFGPSAPPPPPFPDHNLGLVKLGLFFMIG